MLIRLSSNEALVRMSLRLQSTNALKKQNSIEFINTCRDSISACCHHQTLFEATWFHQGDVNQLITPPNALL